MRIRIASVLSLVVLSLAGQGRVQAQTLDTTTFVVMGEGLAAREWQTSA